MASLSVKDGVVSGGGKTVTYGAAGRRQAVQHEADQPATLNPGVSPSKPVSQYKVVGTTVPRVDVPDKISGKYTYVHNVKIPGMLHGRVVRPRGQGPFGTGAPIVSVDEKSIEHIPGAQVVRQGDFLGVVAPRVRRDPGGRAAEGDVEGELDPPDLGQPLQARCGRRQRRHAKAAFRTNTGNVDTALKSAAMSRSRDLPVPLRRARRDRPVVRRRRRCVRLGSDLLEQPEPARHVTAVRPHGLPAKNVRCVLLRGRELVRLGPERVGVVEGGGAPSKLVGAPVRMQFMRWDEHGWDYFQAAQIDRRPCRSRCERQAGRVRLHADPAAVLDGDRRHVRADRDAVSDDHDGRPDRRSERR